jgi:hypothetical protein
MSLNLTEIKQIRRFGLIAFLFFGCLWALGFWREKLLPTYLFGFLSVLGLGFILAPSPSRPVYTAWLQIAHFMGRLITTLMLSLAYYLVITPTSFIKRLFGGTPLPLKPDKRALSYWVTRSESSQPKERFLKRF